MTPCDPSFLFFFLKTDTRAAFAVPRKSTAVSAASREAPAPTAPAWGFYPSRRVLLRDLMWGWRDVGVPDPLEAGDPRPLLVPVPTTTRSSIYSS